MSDVLHAVVTDVSVRLEGGRDGAAGRVELRYDGRWGTVCDDRVGADTVRVICRTLGFTYVPRVAVKVTLQSESRYVACWRVRQVVVLCASRFSVDVMC